jgi:hypothetical protein
VWYLLYHLLVKHDLIVREPFIGFLEAVMKTKIEAMKNKHIHAHA